MDLSQLKAMGLVTSNPLVKREIKVLYHPLLPKDEWADPEVEERAPSKVEGEVTVYLSKLTAADQIAVAAASAAGRDYTYVILSRCVYTEDGRRLFPTEEDARGLDLSMFGELVAEINKLNGGGEKKSLPRTKRGANSRSPSAAERSRSGKRSFRPVSGASGSNTGPSTAP